VARVRFHHLVVETRSTLAEDPAARLLAALPAVPAGTPADVLLESAPGSAAAGDFAPRLPGEPAFDHAGLQLRVAGGLVELCCGPTRFTVEAAPLPHARGWVDPKLMETPLGQHAVAQVPVLMSLAAAVRARGLYHLHAACLVLAGDRPVLVPALAGSGKSTLATALVLAGAAYLGDDTLFVARRGRELRLLALPREFHLSERSARAFGLAARVEPGHGSLAGKGRLDAAAAFPGRFRAEAGPPAAILLPSITGEPVTRLLPAGAAEALGLLLESSVLAATRGLPGGEGHLPLLGELADGARVLRAELGLDLLSDPAGVARRVAEAVADA
jgi:hypothetical protein